MSDAGSKTVFIARVLRAAALAYKVLAPCARWTRFHRLRIGPYLVGEWARRLILPEHRLLVTSFGAKIYSNSAESVTKRLIWDGSYEPGTTRILERLLQRGMTVIDVGAHIGYYTLLACTMVGPAGKVYAFEPEAQNCRLIEHNLALNGLRNACVTCQAVADVDGLVDLWRSERSTGHSLFPQTSSHQATSRVRATTLDSFLANHGWPDVDLIKIDVEGAELAALKGMRQALQRNPGVKLVLEFSPGNLDQAGVDPEDLMHILHEEAFTLQAIDEPSGMVRPFRREDLDRITANDIYPYVNILADRESLAGVGRHATADH